MAPSSGTFGTRHLAVVVNDVLQERRRHLVTHGRAQLPLELLPLGFQRLDVVFPDGTVVRASSIRDRVANDPTRAFGLYLDKHWLPTWPAEVINWPDSGSRRMATSGRSDHGGVRAGAPRRRRRGRMPR